MTMPSKLVVDVSRVAIGTALLLSACSSKNPQDLRIDASPYNAAEVTMPETLLVEANPTEAAPSIDMLQLDWAIDGTGVDVAIAIDSTLDDNSSADTARALDGEP